MRNPIKLLTLLVAASSLSVSAQEIAGPCEVAPIVIVCPIYIPGTGAGPVNYGPNKEWFSLDYNDLNSGAEIVDTTEFEDISSFDAGELGDLVWDGENFICIFPEFDLHPYDRVIDPIFGRFAELGANVSMVLGTSSDNNVILAYDYNYNPVVINLIEGTTRSIGMAARSLFADPDEIVAADMVSLTPSAISADGSTIIGNAWDANGVFRYRIAEGGSVSALQLLHSDWSFGTPSALSSNGDIVAGYAVKLDSGFFHAVKWDAAGQLTQLNPLQIDGTGSMARFITSDGSVIAGEYFNHNGVGVVPFIWNEADGFRALGDPLASDDQVVLESLSADGHLLTGTRYDNFGSTMWYWTNEEGFVDIDSMTGHEGEDGTITGFDPDTGVIFGYYQTTGTYFMRCGTDGPVIDPQEWMVSLSGPIASAASAFMLSAQPMEGAHHRPLSTYIIPGKNEFAWVTGDYGVSNKAQDIRQASGEFGYGCRVGQTGVIGFSAGYYDQSQDFALGGTGESTGRFVIAEAGFNLGKTQFSLTGLIGHTSINTVRAYAVGLGTDSSRGHTDGKSYAFRARIDGEGIGKFAGNTFSPFASVTVDHTQVDGYTETGGSVNAVFNERSDTRTTGRIGILALAELNANNTLRTTLEVVRNFSGGTAGISGTDSATGLIDFSVPGTADRTVWGRVGFDIDHKMNATTVLNFSVHASTRGDAFDTAFALSLRKGF